MFRLRRGRGGFTLIELLVVVAIILTLVAIALPAYTTSLVRAKVTKAQGDLRALHLAMESYAIDWRVYPAESEAEYAVVGHFEAGLTWLTAPISYIGSLPNDPFQGDYEKPISYELGGVEIPFHQRPGGLLACWVLHSYGPDSPAEENHTSRPNYKLYGDGVVRSYSPTNGTTSAGDISIYGGDASFFGAVVDLADRGALSVADKPGLNVDGVLYLGTLPHSGPP